MKKSELPITEISLKDFMKLDLCGYKYEGMYIDLHKPRYYWTKINLVDKVKEEIDSIRCDKLIEEPVICLAIHKEPTNEEVKYACDNILNRGSNHGGYTVLNAATPFEGYFTELFFHSYRTKSGIQTYLLFTGIKNLHTTKCCYEGVDADDETFRIPREGIDVIYLIKY